MQFSTRTRYAIQMMVDLAIYEQNGKVKIKDISRRHGISMKYLEQIITVLSKTGYVKGERGPQGGYRLGMSPDKITTGMIIRLMEGSATASPSESADGAECPWISKCVEIGLWSKISEAVDEILDATTLADLVETAKREGLMDVLDAPEYYI